MFRHIEGGGGESNGKWRVDTARQPCWQHVHAACLETRCSSHCCTEPSGECPVSHYQLCIYPRPTRPYCQSSTVGSWTRCCNGPSRSTSLSLSVHSARHNSHTGSIHTYHHIATPVNTIKEVCREWWSFVGKFCRPRSVLHSRPTLLSQFANACLIGRRCSSWSSRQSIGVSISSCRPSWLKVVKAIDMSCVS